MSCGTFVGAVKCVPKVDSLFGRVGSGRRRRRSIENQKPGGREGEAAGEREERSITTAKKKQKEEEVAKVAHHITLIFYVPCVWAIIVCSYVALSVRERIASEREGPREILIECICEL